MDETEAKKLKPGAAFLLLERFVSFESPGQARNAEGLQAGRFFDAEERDPSHSVVQLLKGNEHWIVDNRESQLYFFIWKWLQGDCPPPRCAAEKEDGFIFQSDREGAYCRQVHACLDFDGCSNRRDENSPYCARHLCVFADVNAANGEAC